MANEAEILNNPTSTPEEVSTGYARQNTNAVASRVGQDETVVVGDTGKCTLQISGPVDVNGVLYQIGTSVDFILSSADRYYIYLSGSGDNLTPTIDTEPGTFDADKNARYYSGYRVLNWIIDYDGADAVAYKWLDPSEDGNNFIENDLIIGGDLTVESTIDSTSKDTGSITTEGGIGIEKSLYTGDKIYAGKGRKPTGTLKGSSYDYNDVYDALSPSLPNIGDIIIVVGGWENITNYINVSSYAERIDATTIYIYGIQLTTGGVVGASTLPVIDGGATAIPYVILSW